MGSLISFVGGEILIRVSVVVNKYVIVAEVPKMI